MGSAIPFGSNALKVRDQDVNAQIPGFGKFCNFGSNALKF